MLIQPTLKARIRTPKPTSAGFTLIEVMVAMAIFSIGILAVFAMQVKGINQNSAARFQSEATSIAAHTMERLMTMPYDHNDLNKDKNSEHWQTIGPYRVEWNVTLPTSTDPAYVVIDGKVTVKKIALTVDADNPLALPVSLSFIRGSGKMPD